MTRRAPVRERDRGMTLTEVLIAISLMGVVAVGVAGAITVVYRSQGSVTRTLSDAHDIQQLTEYFPADIAAGAADISAFRMAGDPTGTGCADDGDANALSFDSSGARIAYLPTTTGSTAVLDRYECALDGGAWEVSRVVRIASGLDVPDDRPPAFAWDHEGRIFFRIELPGGPVELSASPRAVPPTDSFPRCPTANPVAQVGHHGAYVLTGVDAGIDPDLAVAPAPTDEEFDRLRACSAAVGGLPEACLAAGCAQHVDADLVDGGLSLLLGPTGAQVLNIPVSVLNEGIVEIEGGPLSPDRPLIVNVIAGEDGVVNDLTLPALAGMGAPEHVLINLPNATEVTVTGGVDGFLLAPFAHVTTNGVITGGIAAESWTAADGAAGSSAVPFLGQIQWEAGHDVGP